MSKPWHRSSHSSSSPPPPPPSPSLHSSQLLPPTMTLASDNSFSLLQEEDAMHVVLEFPRSSPFLIYPTTFTRDSSEAHGLALASRAIIRFLDEYHELRGAFRIELVYMDENKTWELRACLDPKPWFDKLLHVVADRAVAVGLALSYADGARKSSKAAIVMPRDVTSTPTCKRKGCTKCEGRLHVLWRCLREVPLIHATTRQMRVCDMPVFLEDLVESNQDWVLLRRYAEKTHELLFLPTPDQIENRGFPHGNINMVQDPRFWTAALTEIGVLTGSTDTLCAVTRIVINFGGWETAMRNNPLLAECHAHAHIWLTSDFVHSDKVPLLQGHDAAPEDYVSKNAADLLGHIVTERQNLLAESNRQLVERMSRIEQGLTQISRQLEDLKTFLVHGSNGLSPVPSLPTSAGSSQRKCNGCGALITEANSSKAQRKKPHDQCYCFSCVVK